MSLEQKIKDVITQKLEDGTVETLVEQHLEKGINRALEDLFGYLGTGSKMIKDQIASVMVPYLEKYDYTQYIVKLDDVLTKLLQETTQEHRSLLKNFQALMVQPTTKEIRVTELFEKWKKHVEGHIDTDELEVDYDDTPHYCPAQITYELIEDEKRDWGSFHFARILFECEDDASMNVEIPISRYGGSANMGWDIRLEKTSLDIRSLRHMKEFGIYLMSLDQYGTKIIIDQTSSEDIAYPEKEPEASYS